uniref:Uncharacterized protein n=1 Tax=Plectus sambesii TaxID=2011161 RepID=A0A914XVL2_9BILA
MRARTRDAHTTAEGCSLRRLRPASSSPAAAAEQTCTGGAKTSSIRRLRTLSCSTFPVAARKLHSCSTAEAGRDNLQQPTPKFANYWADAKALAVAVDRLSERVRSDAAFIDFLGRTKTLVDDEHRTKRPLEL